MGLIFSPASMTKFFEIGSLPYLADSYGARWKSFLKVDMYNKLLDKALNKRGIKYLGTYADGFAAGSGNKNAQRTRRQGATKGNILCRIAAVFQFISMLQKALDTKRQRSGRYFQRSPDRRLTGKAARSIPQINYQAK